MEGENKSFIKDPQFLLGLFGGLAVISIIGMIILGVLLINANKGTGKVAGNTDAAAAANNTAGAAKATPAPANLTKSSKPKVELFVMSHCPYGTQIEKGMLPVVEKLGSKIDFEIKFVYYAMHGQAEVNEELSQFCIQTEQNGKYLAYLKCFLGSGNGASCQDSAGIDKAKLASCVQTNDVKFNVTKNFEDETSWLSGRFPLFDVYKADNEKYQVAGSPTLIVNGTEVKTGRDSQSLLNAVCAAFSKAPSECSDSLSAATPAAGFGGGTASSGSAGSGCGN